MKKIFKNKKAQGMVEWIMILALILVAVVALLQQIGGSAKGKASEIDYWLNTEAE